MQNQRLSLLFLLVVLCGLLATTPASAAEPDWSAYAAVLRQYVKPGEKQGISLTLVDYPALKASGALETLVKALAAAEPANLNRTEKLAFYINAYNLLALKMVIDHWPLSSIKEIGNVLAPVWKKPAGQIAGKAVTLDQLEHTILRPLGEPRIHFAIVCASLSCPDLRAEPYTAAQLENQLDDQARQFLNNAAKGLRVQGNKIEISKIFDWFEKDFQKTGDVERFIRHYRPDLPKLPLSASIPYDWDVNTVN